MSEKDTFAPRGGDLAETCGELGPPPLSPGPELMRDVLTVCAKALLSSVPFAVLAFDIGEKAIKFANDKGSQRYLLGLAERIERLRTQVTNIEQRLQHDRLYQNMAQHALLQIRDDIGEAFVADLVNATLNIALLEVDELHRREIAHAIRQLRPVHVAVLRAIDRFWQKDMGDFEVAVIPTGQGVEAGHQLAVWLEHSVPGFEPAYVISELQALHLLGDSVDGGVYGDDRPYVTAARITQFGRDVLGVLASLPPGISSDRSIA